MPDLTQRFLLTGVRNGQLRYQYEILDAQDRVLYRSDDFIRLEEAEDEARLMLLELLPPDTPAG